MIRNKIKCEDSSSENLVNWVYLFINIIARLIVWAFFCFIFYPYLGAIDKSFRQNLSEIEAKYNYRLRLNLIIVYC